MNRNLWIKALFALFIMSSASCMNVATLQTARALKTDEYRVFVSSGIVSGTIVAVSDIDVREAFLEGEEYPYLELGFRTGIAKNLEIGVKWAMLMDLNADVKYQFLDIDGFAAAFGLGATYVFVDAGGTLMTSSATHFDLQVPLYLSYDFDKNFSVYGAPRYLFGLGSSYNRSSGVAGPFHMLGGSVGVRIGHKWGVFAELSAMAGLNDTSLSLFQGNGAVYVDF